MDLIRGADELRSVTDATRAANRDVRLVPTMGALHGGHVSLIRLALDERALDDRPTWWSRSSSALQFGDPADLDRYPRDEARDLALCEALGVDVVWAPRSAGLSAHAGAATPDPGPVGSTFEGVSRPGHFEGVLTVVHRLLDVTGPCAAFFGEKDAEVFLVRRMIDLEGLPVALVVGPTVREGDGPDPVVAEQPSLAGGRDGRVACSSRSARPPSCRGRGSQTLGSWWPRWPGRSAPPRWLVSTMPPSSTTPRSNRSRASGSVARFGP